MQLQGLVADGNGLEDISNVIWSSNLDGVLAESPDAQPDAQGVTRWTGTLSVGTHTILLGATDSDGASAEASISLIVSEAAQMPVADISSPGEFDTFALGATVDFLGVVYDPNQAPDTLIVNWTIEDQATGNSLLSVADTPGPSGATTARIEDAPEGTLVATLTVTDSEGNTDSATVIIDITDPADSDGDGDNWTPNQGDCDDNDPDVFPTNPELCDLKDNDCNGVVDDKDLDIDLHIDEACVAYTGALPVDDCDDTNSGINPAAPELEDGIDNDCNGAVDDGTPSWDQDGDCYCIGPTCAGSENPACVTVTPGDCSDSDPLLNPDDLDADGYSSCEGDCDDSDPLLTPADADTDGFSSCAGDCDDSDPGLSPADVDGDGFTTCQGDCNDVPLDCGAGCYPGNTTPDDCDNFDQDCDGATDEDAGVVWYRDQDGDGWTSSTDTQSACDDPDGIGSEWVDTQTADDCDDNNAALNLDDIDSDSYSTCDLDCDDSVASTYPGAPEICDGVDNNCVNGIDDSPDADNDGFEVCEGDCDDGDNSVFPGAVDVPDLGYVDANCDGIDGDLLTDVFVDALQGSDSNMGGPSDPYQSLSAGIAAASGGANVLVSADQVYDVSPGSLNMVQGTSVYGGYSYSSGWSRSATRVSVTAGTTGLTASGINSEITLSHFAIQAAANTAVEGNSYGGRVLDSSGLRLEEVTLSARSGGPGAPGTDGDDGANGAVGTAGGGGCDGCSSGGAGGAGGGACPDGGAGGRGGYGSSNGSAGSAGGGANPGGAGGGGQSYNNTCIFGCTTGGTGGVGGTVTAAGAPGIDGFGGDGAGAVVADHWRGSIGLPGTGGACGSSGGGGGGGGSDDCCNTDRGGGGGGGGAGEGGDPGTGGTAGGGSIALFLVRSTVHLDGVLLESATGGAGGAAGSGGSAGAGASYGTGGGRVDDGGAGGRGGSGSAGGRGGHGGGGGGGISYGLYKVNSGRTVGPNGVTYSIGSGGPGGASINPTFNGATGNSGQEY